VQNEDRLSVERERKQLELTFPFLTWDSTDINFPPHWHDCFEIIYVRRGRTYASINGEVHEANAGDLILINSGAVHGFFDQSEGISCQGFQFGITFFGEDFIELRDTIFNNSVLAAKSISEALSGQLRKLFDGTVSEYDHKHTGWQLAVKSKFYEIMLLILREREKNPARPASKTASQEAKSILSYIFENFDNSELTLEEAAEVLSMNKFYFTRFFKKHTGQSFHSYLTKTRVDFAKRYLIESKMSIIDIAFSAGFGSLQTFNRVFKTATGRTPSEWRRDNSPVLLLASQIFTENKRP
jgi:AraC-like DNA-binding protein